MIPDAFFYSGDKKKIEMLPHNGTNITAEDGAIDLSLHHAAQAGNGELFSKYQP